MNKKVKKLISFVLTLCMVCIMPISGISATEKSMDTKESIQARVLEPNLVASAPTSTTGAAFGILEVGQPQYNASVNQSDSGTHSDGKAWSWNWDASSNTLTLTNCKVEYGIDIMNGVGKATIVIEGEVDIKGQILCSGELDIKGSKDAVLNILNKDNAGISSASELVIEDITAYIDVENGIGIANVDGDLIVDGAKIYVSTIEGNWDGFHCQGGNIKIIGKSQVRTNPTTSGYTLFAAQDIYIKDEAVVDVSNAGITGGIVADKALIISGGRVTSKSSGNLGALCGYNNGVIITGGMVVTGDEGGNNGVLKCDLTVSGSHTQVTINGYIGKNGNLNVSEGTVEVTKTVSGLITVTGGTVMVNGQIIPIGGIKVAGVELDSQRLSLYTNALPSTAWLRATVIPFEAKEKSVIWASDNPLVATVDAYGNVKAVGEGRAKISVTTVEGGYQAVCYVVVSKASSGGGDSSSSGDSYRDKEVLTNDPIIGTIPSINTNVIDNTIEATVSTDMVNEAIKKAQKQAREHNSDEQNVVMAINIEPQNTLVKHLGVNLPKASVDTLVKEKVGEVRITSDIINMHINLEALKEIQMHLKTDVNILAKKIENPTLSPQIQLILGDRPVYDLFISGEEQNEVTTFGSGKVFVSIGYILQEGETPDGITAYFVEQEDKISKIPDATYNAKEQRVEFSTDHFSRFAVGSVALRSHFTDITKHWAKESIDFVADYGILEGTGNNTFSPDALMTRGMVTTALGRLAKAEVDQYTKNHFTDVKNDAYYSSYIEWANTEGIVRGLSSTIFAPDEALTREQMAVIIANYVKAFGIELPKQQTEHGYLDDADISTWAKEAVEYMQVTGIITGKTQGRFDPKATVSRGEISTVLRRLIESSPN